MIKGTKVWIAVFAYLVIVGNVKNNVDSSSTSCVRMLWKQNLMAILATIYEVMNKWQF